MRFWLLCCCLPLTAARADWQGDIDAESRWFLESGRTGNADGSVSAAMQLEYVSDRRERQDRVQFIGFGRIDSLDSSRSGLDLREFNWQSRASALHVKLGVSREFWAKTEFFHLVDIICQKNLLEDLRAETQLGQPMLKLDYSLTSQRFEFWWLPIFREREFADKDARFQFSPFIRTASAEYESERREYHQDYALRWSSSFNPFGLGGADLGMSIFSGTSRDPNLALRADQQAFWLVPYYPLLEQSGIDFQWALGAWLFKGEAVRRRTEPDNYSAWTAGLEYSFIGLMDSNIDMGLVLELMRDDRNFSATHFFQNDVGLGLRLAFNDVSSTEMLISYIDDRELNSAVWLLEFTRRLAGDWALEMDAAVFHDIQEQDILYGIRQDDFVQVTIKWYF